jgi:hypothetical protein
VWIGEVKMGLGDVYLIPCDSRRRLEFLLLGIAVVVEKIPVIEMVLSSRAI